MYISVIIVLSLLVIAWFRLYIIIPCLTIHCFMPDGVGRSTVGPLILFFLFKGGFLLSADSLSASLLSNLVTKVSRAYQ